MPGQRDVRQYISAIQAGLYAIEEATSRRRDFDETLKLMQTLVKLPVDNADTIPGFPEWNQRFRQFILNTIPTYEQAKQWGKELQAFNK